MTRATILFTTPDRPGLVARLSGFFFDHGERTTPPSSGSLALGPDAPEQGPCACVPQLSIPDFSPTIKFGAWSVPVDRTPLGRLISSKLTQ